MPLLDQDLEQEDRRCHHLTFLQVLEELPPNEEAEADSKPIKLNLRGGLPLSKRLLLLSLLLKALLLPLLNRVQSTLLLLLVARQVNLNRGQDRNLLRLPPL